MLSRVADNLYWMSRYLERAEHTARLLDLELNMMLDPSPESSSECWRRLNQVLEISPGTAGKNDFAAITGILTFDLHNPSSIMSCITAARDNARNVRQQISSEMWEQVNRLFLHVKRTGAKGIWNAQPWEFFRAVKEGDHLLQGITDSTMNHGEGWHFIQVGRFLERAGATAVLLDVHFGRLAETLEQTAEPADYLEWVRLLKSCTAFEAYCDVYTAELRPHRIAEFLLLNPEFPHSVRFSVETVQAGLRTIGKLTATRNTALLGRLAGRLGAALSFSQIDEIRAGGLHGYLESIRRQCGQIHAAIHQTYFAYPVEAALAS